MGFIVPFAELGNYILFSILVGYVALQFVPKANKPAIFVSKRLLMIAVLGIVIFMFIPIIQTISYFQGEVGGVAAAKAILLNFQVGKAWLFIGVIAVLLCTAIMFNGSKFMQATLLLFMIVAVGYSSHAASLSFWTGLTFQSIHFLVITLWSGILIHVAWFSKEHLNWYKFLHWFTPFAIFCFIIIIVSGISLMLFLIEPRDYIKVWVLPYGQMLLLKHISIIPVLVFAFINGVLARKALKRTSFDPKPWIKGESIILFIAFYFTAVMGTLAPPHDVESTVKLGGTSKWAEWLLSKNVISTSQIHLSFSLQGGLLFILATIFLIFILVSFKKRKPNLGVIFGIGFIVSLYAGFMFSLSGL